MFSTGTVATARDSVVMGSGGYGFGAESGGELNIENCVSSSNAFGVNSLGSTVRVSKTTVTDNTTGLHTGSGSLLSRGNNTVQGNATKGAFTGTLAAD